jgi:hypothetical protein
MRLIDPLTGVCAPPLVHFFTPQIFKDKVIYTRVVDVIPDDVNMPLRLENDDMLRADAYIKVLDAMPAHLVGTAADTSSSSKSSSSSYSSSSSSSSVAPFTYAGCNGMISEFLLEQGRIHVVSLQEDLVRVTQRNLAALERATGIALNSKRTEPVHVPPAVPSGKAVKRKAPLTQFAPPAVAPAPFVDDHDENEGDGGKQQKQSDPNKSKDEGSGRSRRFASCDSLMKLAPPPK